MLLDFLDEPIIRELLTGVFAGSMYLTGLIRTDPPRLLRILQSEPESYFANLRSDLDAEISAAEADADAMRILRHFKQEVALLTALADLGGVWPVMTVTQVLTETADAALAAAIRFLFNKAANKGDWLPDNSERPEEGSGYIVLGMGKYGAGELNYSSDIDLIVFFEPHQGKLKAGIEEQPFFVRITRDLVRLMDERTADGYVFRTDLRLRPDAGATSLAMSTPAALQYYESFGQNWERAALIKARAVAGDIPAGENILHELEPFIWRRYLDFAAIADVHAMKRQVHAFKKLGGIGVAGHNIKLGRGGIREIEFFVQTQQLIAGGRQRALRLRKTLQTLDVLVEREWITRETRDELADAYCFLRQLEHRIQMVADEQTHQIPADPDRLERFAHFAGYADTNQFSAALIPVLQCVQGHYAELFEDMPTLGGQDVNMVFAGSENDPSTIEALSNLGYQKPAQVIETVRSWHHGRYAAVRSEKARERLTHVQSALVQALSDTADPDAAIAAFDRFVKDLPAGVQLFSLLRANPKLLRLVADIMGTAPRLARILSRRGRLLDAVIDPRTFETLPSADDLTDVIRTELARAEDFQELLDRARIVGSEQWFLIGVRVLSGSIDASRAGEAYALIAEALLSTLLQEVENELASQHGKVPGGSAAILAMGKLGSREMTAGSDLDLIVIYDYDTSAIESDGKRPLAPAQYYARMTQRLITAMSAPTAEGRLYEVDMRLRPSGQQGPVATRLSSFRNYQKDDAWTWEHLALTRARVVAGPDRLRDDIHAAIQDVLVRPRERNQIAADVLDMRKRIAAEKPTDNLWDIKNVRGGLLDLEFISQFLQLIHAARHPAVLVKSTIGALRKLHESGLLSNAQADVLLPAGRLYSDLTQIMRICSDEAFDPQTAPLGMRELMTRASGEATFEALEQQLRQSTTQVLEVFEEIIV
ncbi:MAG: bifunctional [glutamine synthetase] adenylyltransferase/[glutamine synthetase]-adenylyl-L-tyrosine phosphorylase [Alphaproteobacteria bacterium]|nr:bifunctional [glutamine synthetase] adenylyltransferase/[glutamine synthetase]-adenylyl-L-tyrosine phosphorylase [Alphaproteobacteria bacterium]